MTYSATALILHRRDHGEWDRLYTIYTREHGKLTLIAKGTRRPKAKLASHLEPYSAVDLMIAKGRAMDRVTFARAERHGAALATSCEHISLAAFLATSVDQLTRDGERDVPLFDLLADAFNRVATDGAAAPRPFATGFVIRALSILGYAPQLDRCLECRRAISAVECTTAVPDRGGICCIRCTSSAHNGTPFTAGDRAQLAESSATFSCILCSDAVTSFAIGALTAHIWQPLRTPFPGIALTLPVAVGTLAPS